MWILPFTFLICFGLVVGVYWFAVLRPEGQTRDRVTERLKTPSVVREERAQLINEAPRSSTIPAVDGLLTRNKIFIERNKDIAILSREDAIDYGATHLRIGTAITGNRAT